ncbi:receptor-type tyrosine-protein phosphatase eta [Tenrec ecaudatus]|uniref:receptor-type tyrosine-protein phosphatase eta n=1 Tax=Tenrec ecaudatus TaxID=94439 RepID=UPI003F595D37
MKPAARPPRRSPGLRGALPPLLLLLLSLGQILCAGEDNSRSQNCGTSIVGINATSVNLNWRPSDLVSSYRIQVVALVEGGPGLFNVMANESHAVIPGLTPNTRYNFTVYPVQENGSEGMPSFCQVRTAPGPVSSFRVTDVSTTEISLAWSSAHAQAFRIVTSLDADREAWNKTDTTSNCNIVIGDLSPGTRYLFEIFPQGPNGAEGPPGIVRSQTEPSPVSGLHVVFTGTMEVNLTWTSGNGTANCRMLLEDIASQNESTQDSVVSIKDLKPGTRVKVTVFLLETRGDPEGDMEANSPLRNSTEMPLSSPAAPGDRYHLEPEDSSSSQGSWDTRVWIGGLKPSTEYKATVYSQAENGMEGQPQAVGFWTKSNSQVFDLRVVNISATSIMLTWKIKETLQSSDYIYKIQVAKQTMSFNLTANETRVAIPGLTPCTLYNFTVYPMQDGASEGTPGFLQVYTPPGPVSNFRVTDVSTTEIGLAWSSAHAQAFRIVTSLDADGEAWNKTDTTSNRSIVIGDLSPGTRYLFQIFPQGPNGTEGPPETVHSQTNSSAVFGIRVVYVNTTAMRLEWQSTDQASRYTYHLDIQPEVSTQNTSSREKEITLTGLMPGTLYSITITPEVDSVLGNSSSIADYTRPSSVSNIVINTTTTTAAFSWENFDNASSAYTYRLLIGGNNSSRREAVTDAGITSATIAELVPGSSYTVEIFPQVGNVTEGASSSESFCTDAEAVEFRCEMVPKQPTLVLTFACPRGTNAGFQLDVNSGDWHNRTFLESCTWENSSYRTEVTSLHFATSYNISITTLSCGKNTSSGPSVCTTSITDPPPPDEPPKITYLSHNSVKVKFSGFKESSGPIKAYALILTTGRAEHPSADVLKNRYEDFKRGASDTYVTYFISTEGRQRARGSSQDVKYEIDVGNESTTCGYFNGKLEPLGSYRACVAGFTNITFYPQNHGLIDGDQSYVSFSNYSEVVSLPQDPGVICGAVFGCIFGALVIGAVGGFIFWRKKRKDAKNNEVSFSQIKPKKSKLIKVENFEAYFKKQQADSNCGFAEEYEDLKLVGISQPKYAAELAENRGKNRYNNVLPYDISRVKLSVQTHSTDDYINANYMPGYHSKRDFIATQGPLPNTLKDFWRMVWERNTHAVIMLTKCVEQGRTKCEEYWPSKQSQDYGDITVTMTSEIVLPEWTIRDFIVKNAQTNENHPLRQFHFTSWPDHGVPDTTDLLINFRYLVRDYMKQSPPETPILVHCSAGVGRTGTFIAIDRLIYQMENENTVDVYGIVYDLRMHRPLMVQTEDQYVFLNQCVLDIIRAQKDSKVDLIYQNTTAMTIYENLSPVPTFGKTNGYIA